MSQTAIARIWKAFALQPHRVDTFKLSKDPLFIDKVRDIVGLYLQPPDRALLLSVDEKSQIQALGGTAPILPLRPGQPERRDRSVARAGDPFHHIEHMEFGETQRAPRPSWQQPTRCGLDHGVSHGSLRNPPTSRAAAWG